MDSELRSAAAPADGSGGSPSPEISGLTADSREVRPGYLFAALPGAKLDGRRFIDDAVARGAVAILTDDSRDLDVLRSGRNAIAIVTDANPRRRLALMAARYHAPQPGTVAAITGTSGKTSVAAFARQLWQRTGRPAASLGTLGIIAPDFIRAGALTTPDPVTLHRELAELTRAGIDHVALEASSHGLDQFRLDGLAVSIGVFTNLSRDHLDYHPTMAAYFAAKARLFAEIMPSDATAVLNADVPEFAPLAAICRRRGQTIVSFGHAETADLRIVATDFRNGHLTLSLRIFGAEATVALRDLVGDFQAMNAMAAYGIALASGGRADQLLEVLAELDSVPGRMQRVAAHPKGASIYVDYAHKPDALQTVLTALRPHVAGRLVVVFGCGGDRDAGKRPLMGAIAHRLADRVIVTDDNPRSERPARIRAAIVAACPGAGEIGDRRAAIRAAILGLAPSDLLVVAGKGHESGQIVGGTVHPFDDATVAREIVAELAGAAP
jgi:UDP-N-acetylmuramoyl-L-alanyl-D-glutamate--2,6-diaminopimelate ligase